MDPDSRYKWTVLAIACIGSMMAPLDSSIVSVTLPEMAQSLHMDYVQVIWVPTAYLVTIAALLLSFGRLSDLRGRKPYYLIGFAIFTVSSIACSLSHDGSQLIVSRIAQGVGGAFMMAVSPALITATFPGKERGKALGINAMFVYIGLSLGPPLGGFLTDLFGWPSIFWVNVPIGALAIILGALVIKEEKVHRPGRFDLPGAFLFALSLVTLLLALTFGEEWGWGAPLIIVLFLIFAASFYAFVRTEQAKGSDAMLDPSLFRKNRMFAAGNISALLNYTSYFGVSFIASFYLQRVLGLGLTTAGLILLVMPLVMAFTAPLSGWMSDRIGSRMLSTGGMVIIAMALLLMSTLGTGDSGFLVALYLGIMGLGMGLFSSPNTSSVMGCVPNRQLGVASGAIATMRTVGQSFSLTIMGAIIAVVAGTDIANSVFGGGGPLPPMATYESFVNGMHAAFQVGAVIALIGAATSSIRGGKACEPMGQ
ncbi:MAG: putative transporter [Methanomassiliicoccales archaeon PtaU1.Bin124]|nr:MAG: putative transporter [Methanomassiliicoccales archaeon PtaU1.Bin124]